MTFLFVHGRAKQVEHPNGVDCRLIQDFQSLLTPNCGLQIVSACSPSVSNQTFTTVSMFPAVTRSKPSSETMLSSSKAPKHCGPWTGHLPVSIVCPGDVQHKNFACLVLRNVPDVSETAVNCIPRFGLEYKDMCTKTKSTLAII